MRRSYPVVPFRFRFVTTWWWFWYLLLFQLHAWRKITQRVINNAIRFHGLRLFSLSTLLGNFSFQPSRLEMKIINFYASFRSVSYKYSLFVIHMDVMPAQTPWAANKTSSLYWCWENSEKLRPSMRLSASNAFHARFMACGCVIPLLFLDIVEGACRQQGSHGIDSAEWTCEDFPDWHRFSLWRLKEEFWVRSFKY